MADNLRQMQTVMISSTARDLPEHRQQVMDACMQQGMHPIAMEHLPASDADAIQTSLAMVDEAEIYLGVIGFRYGHVPTGHTISITEMEYNRAVRRGIPCLIFLMHGEHPIKASDFEKGEGGVKLDTFKERLTKAHIVNYFTSPDDLRARVINSLSQMRRTPLQQATISYPWLDTNYLVVDGNEVKEIRLQVRVHDEPAAPDAQKGILTISSLHNLKLEVWMPVAVNETGEGSHWCPVGSLDEVEWNNYKAASVIGMIALKNDTTLLEMRGSSNNAIWHEIVIVHRKTGYVDWEKYLAGSVMTPQGKQTVQVGEIRQNKVTFPYRDFSEYACGLADDTP